MNEKQIKRILSGAGYPTDGSVLQTPEITTLEFSTNYGVDYHKDFISFDTDTGLIKIKNYFYKAVSGLVDSFTTTDNITLWAEKFTISKLHPRYVFRNITTGDYVFKVNKTTGKIIQNKWVVTKAGTRFIVLDKALTFDPKKEILCYCAAESYSSLVADPLNSTLFFRYTPYTENTTDVYLDLYSLFGIELISPKLGVSSY